MKEAGNFLPRLNEVKRETLPRGAPCRSLLPPTGRLVCVAAGSDWSLWWPLAAWCQLPPNEQEAVITQQTAVSCGELRNCPVV